MIRRVGFILTLAGFLMLASAVCMAQEHVKYEPTIESLDNHPLPQWYAGAKLGIFIHWGLYSVPGWAPLSIPITTLRTWTTSRTTLCGVVPERHAHSGSPTQAYHNEHYGANFSYYDFAPIFNRESKKWNPTSGQRPSATQGRAMWC